jgi:ribosomal protein S18 acetylase RimI-like enzyme
VKVLSNFLRKGDGPEPKRSVEYRQARPDETHHALSLILGSGGNPAGSQQVIDFLQFAAQRGINTQDLWVMAAGAPPIWAVLPIVSPGHTVLLFTPGVRPPNDDVTPLIEAVCMSVAERDIHLVQVLLDPPDKAIRSLYAGLGFREMAELIYLQVGTSHPVVQDELPENFWWQTYSPQTHELFEQAILESYQQSLDCPALNGMRDISDVIAGHKASGEFNPRFWFVLTERDMPRAVLLLSRVPRTETAELVYLGVVPQMRGRGTGDLVMRQALWAVREMNLTRLTLAVDSQNGPALALYYRHGMQRVGTKIAMMLDLRSGTPQNMLGA